MSAMKCPICKQPCPPRAKNPAYPFCSSRCQMIDLGRWLDGDYRIPGDPVDDVPLGDAHAGAEDGAGEPWPPWSRGNDQEH